MVMGNTALDVNPTNSMIDINTNGSDWLWAVFAVMLLSDLAMVAWYFMRPRGARAFHVVAIAILSVAVIAYYSMASDLGATPIVAEFYGARHQDYYGGIPQTRAIWYVRYIMWFLTGPLLVLEVLLASALPPSDIFGAMFMMDVGVICGLVGALTSTSYKWGYYVFGLAALIYTISVLLHRGRISARGIGNDVGTIHTRGAAFLAFLWLLYPISWGLSEGGNVITSNGEMVFYGILDLLTMPAFLFLHLFQLRTVDHGRFGMTGVGAGGVGGTGRHFPLGGNEKFAGGNGGAGAPGVAAV